VVFYAVTEQHEQKIKSDFKSGTNSYWNT